jgi:hypothetical protein
VTSWPASASSRMRSGPSGMRSRPSPRRSCRLCSPCPGAAASPRPRSWARRRA